MVSLEVLLSPDIKFSERENACAHITHLSRCGCGLPLCVSSQIQTYQVLQEHLANLLSIAASGLVNHSQATEAR